MEIRVCPECKKVFFACSEADILMCHHCGHILLDRRDAERISSDMDLTFRINSDEVSARLVDYSERGLKITYRGRILSTESEININIEELNLKGRARTVWTRRHSKNTHSSGLQIL